MAGDSVIKGSQPVEWVEETTFATAEEEATWEWFGLGTSFSVTEGVESQAINYLPEHGANNKLSKRVNVKHSEMYEAEMTYHPQNFDLFQYFTGADGDTADSPSTLQVGEVDEDNGEYRRLLGGMGEELTLSIGEESAAEVNASFVFADGEAWGTDDYIGTGGAHATEDASDPFAYKDLGNVTYGGTALHGAVESIELTVSNDIAVVKDPDQSRSSLIAALIPVDRDITVDVTLTYDSHDMASEVRSYSPQDFVFDIDTTTITVSDVRFSEYPYEYSADDLVSDTLSSDPATNVTWTTA